MKPFFIFILACLCACGNNQPAVTETNKDSVMFQTNDTIPEMRKTVSSKPVAAYVVPVNDPRLERTFGVSIYETPFTFKFRMRMHYEAMEVNDTLEVPNFGVWPVVRIQAGKDKQSCIIGFLDKKNVFAPYKKLSANGDKMKLETLRSYFVGRYRTVQPSED